MQGGKSFRNGEWAVNPAGCITTRAASINLTYELPLRSVVSRDDCCSYAFGSDTIEIVTTSDLVQLISIVFTSDS